MSSLSPVTRQWLLSVLPKERSRGSSGDSRSVCTRLAKSVSPRLAELCDFVQTRVTAAPSALGSECPMCFIRRR